MKNAIFPFSIPENEPILSYLEGSKERIDLEKELDRLSSENLDIPLIIGGKEVRTNDIVEISAPHDHSLCLGHYHRAGKKEVQMAIDAALRAHEDWDNLDWTVRASILLKIAELLSTKYRATINAATMLAQSKNIFQAEIDSACETIDFLRYNVAFASKIYGIQPKSFKGEINSVEYRALEGFVFSVSPFNFTSIASNLNMSPILMGNTTVWKPSSSAVYSNFILMKIFMEAGVPSGVINFIPGRGSMVGDVIFSSPYLAGIHFTGSSKTFNHFWELIGSNMNNYKAYPRIIGETGGKDFIFVHKTADAEEVANAAFAGSYEFQGQKCSASSRMYVPKSLWADVFKGIDRRIKEIKMGDVKDPQNFINAVIDEAAFDKIESYINKARNSKDAKIICGGKCDKSKGYFIEPTLIECKDPKFVTMKEEIFGPVLSVYVYDDDKIDETLELCDNTTPYGLTGAVFGKDRLAVQSMMEKLKYTAGNFYINDKPTGAVVGMQPFGGARASGTNDKAGGEYNLMRWVLPRTIKETFVPSTTYRYKYM
ncbi:MAG: L-glutamate gamma-semialdehyde dehydrogenase [Bacteroidales bacterium]